MRIGWARCVSLSIIYNIDRVVNLLTISGQAFQLGVSEIFFRSCFCLLTLTLSVMVVKTWILMNSRKCRRRVGVVPECFPRSGIADLGQNLFDLPWLIAIGACLSPMFFIALEFCSICFMYMHMYMYGYVYMFMHMYMHICTCIDHICVYLCTCIHICIYSSYLQKGWSKTWTSIRSLDRLITLNFEMLLGWSSKI